MSVLPTKDPAPYHAHIRAVAEKMPMRVGDWVASDVPNDGTKEALNANVMINRQWVNGMTGQQISLLFTQCSDMRDLVPHYPAVCYPAHGLTQVQTKSKTWIVDGLRVSGIEYEFDSNDFRQANTLFVENFFVLPGGAITGDMKEVRSHLPLRDRYYGVGQVQIVFGAGMAEETRDDIVRQLVAAYKPLIDAILAGKVQ